MGDHASESGASAAGTTESGSTERGTVEAAASEQAIEQAVARVLDGDVEAFAPIIRRYQETVWRIASLSLRDQAATEDLAQQVFVSVYEHLGSYQRGRDFGAWLRTIARNQVRQELRRQGRDVGKLRRYHAYLSVRLQRAEEAEAHERGLRQALERCREQLAAPSREALALRYEGAQSYDAISEALGRTVAATRQLLVRTRLALRQCIEKRMAHS